MLAPRHSTLLAAAAIALAFAGWASAAAAADDITPSPAFTAKQLTAPPTDGWYTNGGNIYNQRYSPLDQITRANVSDLKAVWRTSLNGSGKNPRDGNQVQILAYDGVVYVQTGENDVFAVSVDTGKILWTYKANIDASKARPCCGWPGRGVGMGDGKIFVGKLDAKLAALDQRTGKVIWEIQAEDATKGYSIASAPLYYDGMVITGFGGSDLGVRGHIDAYDADTGKHIWRYYTIPAPGEPGSETWPKDSDVWKYGGAAIWQTPAIDPELGLLYFVTANPGPTLNGAARPGDNLYTDSIMAIDVKTGKYKWHFQEVHHDIWDFDAANPVILFDAKYHGKMRKGIAEAGKTGWIYILDRTNGKPLVGIPEKPVMQNKEAETSPTQPIPVGDALVPQSIDVPPEGYPNIPNNGKIYTPYDSKTIGFWAPQGAVNWPPSSYDPRTHRMFVCATDAFWGGQAGSPDMSTTPGKGSFAGGRVLRPYGGGADRGIFSAVDLTTNKVVWHQQWTDPCYNPSIATGAGIVFVGRSDGRMTALNSDNGNVLWDFQTDGGINAPASTFLYKGTQYVVVFAGGTSSARSKPNDGVWLFSLEGTMASLPRGSADAAATIPHGPPMFPPTRPANLDHGKKLYTETCASCHEANGEGGVHGAPLTDALSEPLITQIVQNGRNKMPAFGSIYSGQDIRDLAGYVLKLNAALKAAKK